jgi:hypothetical protein
MEALATVVHHASVGVLNLRFGPSDITRQLLKPVGGPVLAAPSVSNPRRGNRQELI